MRLIKGFIIGLIVLFVLLVLMGLLLPSTTIVSRAIDLPAPPASVLPWLADVNRWPYWMEGLDSNQIKKMNDSVTRIGKMEVVMLVHADTLIQTRWLSAEGQVHLSAMRLIPSDEGRLCTVQWQFEQQVGWLPWERLGTLLHEKVMGPQLENNLERLRQRIISPQ